MITFLEIQNLCNKADEWQRQKWDEAVDDVPESCRDDVLAAVMYEKDKLEDAVARVLALLDAYMQV